MDVSRDPRLLIAEVAVKQIEDTVRDWRLPWRINRDEASRLVREAKKIVYNLRYSYMRPRELAGMEEASRVREIASELARSLLNPPPGTNLSDKQRLALATIRWAVNILGGLKARLLLGDDPRPEYAVDVVGVEVTRVEDLVQGLKLTRASTGNIVLTVVTNLADIKEGEVRAAAILPPRTLGGVISEAMYSSGPLDRSYLGRRVPSNVLSSELAGIIMSLLKE